MSEDVPPRTSFASRVRAVAPGLPDAHVSRLAGYRDLLYTHNQRTNLTAVRDLDGIERRLIVESLRLLEPLSTHAPDNGTVIDIGTGGGVPGMVLAIARPDLRFTLLDATGKKVAFLERVSTDLELSNATPVHGRAEEIAHDPSYRGRFNVATARAVSSLAVLLELGLPLVRQRGWLLLPKGLEIDDELAMAERAAVILGGRIVEAPILPDSGSSVETRLVKVTKTAPTPGLYPRRAGLPARSPLGSAEGIGRPAVRDRGGTRHEQ